MKADDLIRCGDINDRTSMLSWREMFVQGSFDALVANALPTAEEDADAARYFLRVFTVTPNLFLLSRQSIELIEEYADRDDRFALFALGRYRLCTMTKPDSLGEACGYIRRAHALGLPEATAEMAQMYDYGDFGLVDRAAARALLDEALERNCDYAAEIYLKNLIFGKNGYEADLQKALAIIGERLANDIGRLGAGEENPMWYYLKGCCECNTEGYPAAVGNFRKAAEMGVIMAWADVAVACSHNAEDVLVDKMPSLRLRNTACRKGMPCAAISVPSSQRTAMTTWTGTGSNVQEKSSLPGLKRRSLWAVRVRRRCSAICITMAITTFGRITRKHGNGTPMGRGSVMRGAMKSCSVCSTTIL